MIINILGAGPENLIPDIKQYDTHEEECLWLGVDKGVLTLLAAGITPDYAFGDFDSVGEQEWGIIENKVKNLRKYKPEKDETDMELAVNWALTKKPKIIRLFGATGGRLDHLFGNVQVLLKPELQNEPTHIEMIDCQNHLYVKGPGHYTIQQLPERKYISFVPISPVVKGLTLEGFKYPLSNSHISHGSTLCISNELVSTLGTFSFLEGIVMVIRSND